MKLTRSQIFAIIASLALVFWFVIRNLDSTNSTDSSQQQAEKDTANFPTPTVLVIERSAAPHQQVLELFGQSEANRQVSVKANTASVVVKTPLKEGQIVNEGDIMCVQIVNERDARVAQASAQVQRAQLEYDAAVKLAQRGFRSETQVATQKANLDAASASLTAAEIERGNVNMVVPFRGLFERQEAQVGDYLAPGQPCGLVVEIDPLIVTVQLTETQLSKVKIGQTSDIKLATGERVQGTLKRVESIANPSTRSFRTEIAVPNRKMTLKAGVTAEVRLLSDETVMAQNIPAGILSLSDSGDVGVRYLDSDDRVRFARTTTIDEDENGVWVTGLPERTRIIIKGQDFVADGTHVIPTLQID